MGVIQFFHLLQQSEAVVVAQTNQWVPPVVLAVVPVVRVL
jgi:hypothetical protein